MNYKIGSNYNATIIFENSISFKGNCYLLIYGKHINGYFCCVPNFSWGCEMSEPSDIYYNTDKLIESGADKETATAISEAIYTIIRKRITKE